MDNPSDAELQAALQAYRENIDDHGRAKAMLCALLAAAQVRAKTHTHWRDVKTDPPPRDGTRIVVWIDESSEAMVAFWGKHDWLNEEWWIATDEMNAVNPEYVTRWMPLPPAPEPKP